MIPQVPADLKQEFTLATFPSRTFRIHHDTNIISGTVDQLKAVEQAVFLMLSVERYAWLIYSWNYGVELNDLIGRPASFCIPELERRITEALRQDDRITGVEDFRFEVGQQSICTTFQVVSIYGSFAGELEVET